MKHILAVLILTVLASSCSRFYYDTVEADYDLGRAVESWKNLKDGLLVVQVPCYGKKEALLKKLAESAKSPAKREEYATAYTAAVVELNNTQQRLFEGVEKYYNFSKYAFVPDTLIRRLQSGQRNGVFINNAHKAIEVEVDSSQTIMLLRDTKDFDYLQICNLDGSVPTRPFPFMSTVGTANASLASKKRINDDFEGKNIYNAIYILDHKLKKFGGEYYLEIAQ